jgi:Ankyrin repeats (many copies)
MAGRRWPVIVGLQIGNEPIVRQLHETGKADVNLNDRYVWTPLLLASKNGYGSITGWLLESRNWKSRYQEGFSSWAHYVPPPCFPQGLLVFFLLS